MAAISNWLVPVDLQGNYRQSLTRLEFCQLVSQGLRMQGVSRTISEAIRFDDTEDADVLFLATLGLVQGVGNHLFDPDGLITREQAAVLLTNYLHNLNHSLTSEDFSYADADHISDWAADSVTYVSCYGIMKGDGENRFDPQGFYTREQAIMTMLRVFQLHQT